MARTVNDWQISCETLNARGIHLLRTGQWSDCTFIVGNEPNQTVVKGHKLLLAMASPVFEAMFYGGIPEGNDPILILDLQPDAFKALLEYIYSDKISINTFDKACELCYAAKKYMLPHLVQECTKYMWSDLNPKNACRAYEFARLFEEPNLMEKCLQIISTRTSDVLSESSFEEIALVTLIKIFELEHLNIESELDLFNAAVRYANAQINNQSPHTIPVDSKPNDEIRTETESDSPQMTDTDSDMQIYENHEDHASQSNTSLPSDVPTTSSNNKIMPEYIEHSVGSLSIRNALQNIRFLTLTPQQFAEGPAKTNLLTQAEAFAILMNISSSRSDYPMPEGFTTLNHARSKILVPKLDMSSTTQKRHVPDPQQFPFRQDHKYYCQRSIIHETDCLNTNDLECSVTFTVDKNICVYGVQIPTQVLGENPTVPSAVYYSELLYAHLLDADGSRLTYTHFTSRVPYSAVLDITFNRPFYIQRNKVYKVAVVFNKLGWYPTGSSCTEIVVCDEVCFSFRVGPTNDSVRHSLIRSIIFGY